MGLQVHPLGGVECQDCRDTVGFLAADVIADGRRAQRVAGKMVVILAIALVVAQGDGETRDLSQRSAAMNLRPEMVAFPVLRGDLAGKLIAGFFQHVVDRAGQGGAAIQGALRPLHHFHPFQGGQGDAGMAFFDDDAFNEQAGIGAAKNVGLPSYHRTEIISAEGLGKIEPRRVVGDILQGSDTPFLQRRLGERADRQWHVLQVFLAFPCGNDDLFNGVLSV